MHQTLCGASISRSSVRPGLHRAVTPPTSIARGLLENSIPQSSNQSKIIMKQLQHTPPPSFRTSNHHDLTCPADSRTSPSQSAWDPPPSSTRPSSPSWSSRTLLRCLRLTFYRIHSSSLRRIMLARHLREERKAMGPLAKDPAYVW